MRVAPECWPCLVRRSVFEGLLVDPRRASAAGETAWDVLFRSVGPDATVPEVATSVHAAVYRTLGVDDPYAALKAEASAAARRLLPRARAYVAAASDPFRAAVLSAIAGNVLDFGIGSHVVDPAAFETIFQRLVDQDLAVDDTAALRDRVAAGKEVVVLGDNAGEIVLDVLLVEALKALGPRVTYVVRGAPILSDATLADAGEVGMDTVADDLESTGSFSVGLNPEAAPPGLRERLARAGVVVAKGMANWERLHAGPYRPIAFLLHTKCEPVARSLGVAKGVSVARLVT